MPVVTREQPPPELPDSADVAAWLDRLRSGLGAPPEVVVAPDPHSTKDTRPPALLLTVESSRPAYQRPWAWAAGVAALVAVAIFTVATINGGGGTPASRPSAVATGNDQQNAGGQNTGGQDAGGQNAGVVGENVPPGVPTVTGTRTGPGQVRFAWVYSATLANDTFRWRTADGRHSGVAAKPSVDLADRSGVRVCLQVKVVRADGSGGNPGWSPPGCAT